MEWIGLFLIVISAFWGKNFAQNLGWPTWWETVFLIGSLLFFIVGVFANRNKPDENDGYARTDTVTY